MRQIYQKDILLIVNAPLTIKLPSDANVFTADHYDGRVMLSYLADDGKKNMECGERKFMINVSDNKLDNWHEYVHLGTFQVGIFLYHVFEIVGNKES